MIVMPGNNSGYVLRNWARSHAGQVGWMLTPGRKTMLKGDIPFAVDNGIYAAWSAGKEWDPRPWLKLIVTIADSGLKPLWAVVPDAVADLNLTLTRWLEWRHVIDALGWPMAFVVQDGAESNHVPVDAAVVFVGGTTAWKWRSLPYWCRHFKRVHVGRVNHPRRLETCERLGVESVDGTGWFRESQHGKPARDLGRWLAGHRDHRHPELFELGGIK